MSQPVRALRGATTVERDERAHINERVQELVKTIFERNQLNTDDLISIIFTATSDISSCYPASAARGMGLDDVPLLGAQELDVDGMLPLCIRVMVHCQLDRPRSEVQHVYLHGAVALRSDLVK